ncbi:MAG: helix-turn-helix transcriptional regulator [Deltaproteobacteria bacterium]|nr:helix-turn-helix transcriptional regulator [Deltaproteobacteria bacterium]
MRRRPRTPTCSARPSRSAPRSTRSSSTRAARPPARERGSDHVGRARGEHRAACVGCADPPVDRVRRALGQGAASLPDVARRIGTSSRTLRRHLEREGLTLRGLVDDVRRARADELLAAGTAVKEVAFALGFSEPSAFSRAYKRWTGRAPRSS